MNILSIQSHVSYGHVGNSAAVFPLQRLGHEVWPVYTVNFSNHTGYGQWGGSAIAATEVAAIIDAMDARGALARVDAVLSGYQGSAEIADVILSTVARIKAHTDLPICVGFGVKTAEHARLIGASADGVVVGTAIVNRVAGSLDAHGKATANTIEETISLVRELSDGVRAARAIAAE